MSAASNDNHESTLIVERLHAVRERIARRLARPGLKPPEIHVPSLEAVRDSRATAAHLADAIGTVNPRPPGVVNELIQSGKRSLARALHWVVRPQRDFNRAILDSLARTSEVLEASNRNMLALVEALTQSGEIDRALGEEMDSVGERFDQRSDELREKIHRLGEAMHEEIHRLGDELREETDHLGDEFREESHRFGEAMNEKMRLQQWSYDGALARQATALQDRMYELLGELQKHLWEEMRVLRQRAAAQARADSARSAETALPAAGTPAPAAPAGIDYFQIERHFRGTEEEIRERQRFYVPFFQGRQNVLDIACGRGEFLELMRHANVNARGVDLDSDMAGRCLEKGLSVTQADVFRFLENIPNGSLDGIFCSQFVEHLKPEAYVRLLMQCGEKLAVSGILAVETQNPECLAIFSQSFYLDPTHVQPIPPALLRVLFAEAGMDGVTTHYLSPGSAALPVIPELATQAIEPDALKIWNASVRRFNETFFGSMDYAVIGYRAGSVAGEIKGRDL